MLVELILNLLKSLIIDKTPIESESWLVPHVDFSQVILRIFQTWKNHVTCDWLKITQGNGPKFAGPRPQAGNRGAGLANKAFALAGPAELAIICENYIAF